MQQIHITEELQHFLSVYKELEYKKVKVLEVASSDAAKKTIKENIELFEKTFCEWWLGKFISCLIFKL